MTRRTRKAASSASLVGMFFGVIVLLCHFLIHQRPLLPQTAGTSGQRFDQSDGQLTADACDGVGDVALRPDGRCRAGGSLGVAQVPRSNPG